MGKTKYYVVWRGKETGIYDSWNECKSRIEGFEGALYKSFNTSEAATEAYHKGPWEYIGKEKKITPPANISEIIKNSLAVDAACSGNPGLMEYRGVYVATGQELFRIGPYKQGTNNIGEFLAIVHGLAFLKQQNSKIPIYTDSVNAMLWVKNKKCKTKLEQNNDNAILFDLIERAEKWLKDNSYSTPIIKWNTEKWGEIPADFGRK